MKPFDLKEFNARYSEELKRTAAEVIDSGWYLTGERVRKFEQELAAYLQVPYVVTTGNGLDALRLILRGYIEMGVMKEGDEIIVPANTFIATFLAITDNRLVPVPVEPDEKTYNLDIDRVEASITSRTKAIFVVHLYGRCNWDKRLGELRRKYGLKILEDNAQAIGAYTCADGVRRHTGTLGDAAAISFYPVKNLGALGDAGAMTTADSQLATVVRSLANYGSSEKYVFQYRGVNSRMDELQAAFLSVKLKYLEEDISLRRERAGWYSEYITNGNVRLPDPGEPGLHVWHQYVVRCSWRDELKKALEKEGIHTLIHYPVPPHLQACYRSYRWPSLPVTEQLSREVLSLPFSPTLTRQDIEKVANVVNRNLNKKLA